MNKRLLGIVGSCLIAAMMILIVALPVSGDNVSGSQNGTGNQYGGHMIQNGAKQAGQLAGNGNGTCIREDCPNNGTPKQDGTGMQYGKSGNGCGNGGKSGQSGQGCGHQSRT